MGRKASSHWLTLLEIAKLPQHHLHPLRKGAGSVRDLGMDPTLGKLSGSHHVQPGMTRVINVLRKAILKQPARARQVHKHARCVGQGGGRRGEQYLSCQFLQHGDLPDTD